MMDALTLRREVEATGWYMGHRAVRVDGQPCAVCTPGSGVLLRQLHHADVAKPRRLRKQAQPRALEGRYRAQLKRRMRKIHRLLLEEMQKEVKPRRPEINARALEQARSDAAELTVLSGTAGEPEEDALVLLCLGLHRLDGQQSDTNALMRVIDLVERAVRAIPVGIAAVGSLAADVLRFTSRSVTRQLLTIAGIDVTETAGQTAELLEEWAQNNVELITSLDDRYFDDIRTAVLETVGQGHSTRALSKAISERYGVTRSRADLIATDQVGTLNGQITQHRQTTLGVEKYTWSDSNDSRVRPKHRELDGTVRKWSEPHPTEGHPGTAIRCRCSAIPVIP